MTHSRTWRATICALGAAGVLGAGTASAWECASYPHRRAQHFEDYARRRLVHCQRRDAGPCPDETLTARLDRVATRIATIVTKRCPAVGIEAMLAAARRQALCVVLGVCQPGSITVRVGGGASSARTAGKGTRTASALAVEETGRRLRADAGWTGLAHDLQILEGASYTADLSACDGSTDTLCGMHGATAGTAFGAPSPLSVGGISVCVSVDFASDLTGTYDVASGALDEEAAVDIRVYLGGDVDQPCPACIAADGAPQLGEAGTCAGGPNDGGACVVGGLGDPSLGPTRATSNDCPPGEQTRVARFLSHATATTGAFDFAPLPDGPTCTSSRFVGETCLCSTCNDLEGTACHSNADCPVSGGAPGICGGRRCLQGGNAGSPCASQSECPGGFCSRAGEPTARNACIDDICTPTGDGRGVCAAGPIDTRCEVARQYGCLEDRDCPAGDRCIEENRRCSLDTIALDGIPDQPVDGIAQPTLVGGFCMGSSRSASADYVAGFPGPVTYEWPTEIRIGQ